MTTLSRTVAALALAAVAVPSVTFAQGLVVPSNNTTIAQAIADLEGTTRAITPAQADAFGLPALPAGESYGLKDSRIVVLDAQGGVTDIVRVVADLGTTS